MAETEKNEQVLTKKDFVSPNDVRWCPGCGDYAILNAIQTVFPQLGIPREKFVVVSGIGCSSRFPYYMNTYGFHTIHGRAPTIATGIKVANPDLSVWIITGDGDGLSIGGNHMLHLLRRNVNVNVLLFNNRVYGLTKGQYSPTSLQGMRTKSSPMGSVEHPINPLCFALAAEATFVARTVDTNPKHMVKVFKEAAEHKGTSFVEIFQNCVIFNDKTWAPVSGREVRDEQMLVMEENKPLMWGKDQQKGLRLNGLKLEKVVVGEDGVTEKDLLVHRTDHPGMTYHYLLTQMSYPDLPTPVGVFRKIKSKTFDQEISDQINDSMMIKGRTKNLHTLLRGQDSWVVEADGIKSQEGEFESIGVSGVDDEEAIMNEQASEQESTENDKLLGALKLRLGKLHEDYEFDRIVVLKPDEPISQAISYFKVYHVGCMLVEEDGKLVGIVTERDILRKVCLKNLDLDKVQISEIMTKQPDWLNDWSSVADAINHCSVGGFRHLPVLEKNGKYSVVSMSQLLGFIYDVVRKN